MTGLLENTCSHYSDSVHVLAQGIPIVDDVVDAAEDVGGAVVDGANAVAGAVTDGTGLVGDALTDAYNQAADKVPWSWFWKDDL